MEGLGAAAEAASDMGLDDADARLLHPQAAREHEMDVVGHLGACVHGEPAPLRVVVREGRVHLHLRLADLGAAVGLLAHEVRPREGRIHVPQLVLDVALDVAGALLVEVDRVRGRRRLGRVVGGKLVGLDPDEGEGALGGRVVVRRDGRDRLPPVAHPVPGEGVLVHRDGEDAEGPVAVRAGDDGPAPRGGPPPPRCRRSGSRRAPRGCAGSGPRARPPPPAGRRCSGPARSPCRARPRGARTPRWSGPAPACRVGSRPGLRASRVRSRAPPSSRLRSPIPGVRGGGMRRRRPIAPPRRS